MIRRWMCWLSARRIGLPTLAIVILPAAAPAQPIVDDAVQSSQESHHKVLPVAADRLLQPASDFAADARLAQIGRIPILVAITRDDCSYCLTLKRDILLPMLRSGDYKKRVIMRELNIDSAAKIKTFDFDHLSSLAWAQQYKATFTPTVLLLDHTGKEVAKRLVGINTVSMYGWYLDEAIVGATETIRAQLN